MTDQTTTAPVESPASDGALSLDAAITAAVQQTMANDPDTSAPNELPRDERGRFVSPTAGDEQTDSTAAPSVAPTTPEAAADAAPPVVAEPTAPGAEPAPETPTLPEGVVMPKPVARPLATEFTLRAPDGDALAIPEVLIEFTAAGQPRTEPLDKVVRLAQMGYHQAEREQRYEQIAQESAQAATRVAAIEREAEQLREYARAILSDPTGQAWLQAHEEYAAEQSPERVLARERAALAAERQRVEQQHAAAEGQRFFETELAPALDGMLHAMPSVLQEELGAKLLLTLKPHEVDGVIPPARYAAVRAAIVQDVLPWMRSLHETRSAMQRQTTSAAEQAKAEATAKVKQLEAAKAKAEAEAQKAKRSIGRAATPVARGGVASNAPPPRPIETVTDAMEASVDAVLRAMRQQQPAA